MSPEEQILTPAEEALHRLGGGLELAVFIPPGGMPNEALLARLWVPGGESSAWQVVRSLGPVRSRELLIQRAHTESLRYGFAQWSPEWDALRPLPTMPGTLITPTWLVGKDWLRKGWEGIS